MRSSGSNCLYDSLEDSMNMLSAIFSNFVFIIKELLDPDHNSVLRLNRDRYIVERHLGEGGFAFVLLVKRVRTGERFALKKVRIQLSEQQTAFQKEVNEYNSLKTSFVIKLVDSGMISGKDPGTKFGLMLMPLYENGTIQDIIEKSKQPISLANIKRWIDCICQGLLVFHQQNPPKAFRDLKPANVLLGADNIGVLTDLGSVDFARKTITNRKEAIELQERCAEHCSAPFRAPELFDVKSDAVIDERTDVWSLGCTLFALAYKNAPFDGTLTSAIGKVPFPAKDNYPPIIRQLITEMLKVNPKERPFVPEILNQIRTIPT